MAEPVPPAPRKLPPQYLEEHNELSQLTMEVVQLIGEAKDVVLTIGEEREKLAQERKIFQEEKQALLEKSESLQENLEEQHVKKEARIQEHIRHHNEMMVKLREAKENLQKILGKNQ